MNKYTLAFYIINNHQSLRSLENIHVAGEIFLKFINIYKVSQITRKRSFINF